jgi:O-antigen ligase
MSAGLALFAGVAGAVMHFAGALKAVEPLARLPVDLTVLALAATLAGLVLLLAAREVALSPWLGPPLLGCGLLWLWWVVASAWSPWPGSATERLRDILLLGPLMLASGMLLGADARARSGFMAATIAIGLLVGLSVALGLWRGSLVLGGEVGRDPTRLRVAYQIVGLAIACAGGLVALRVTQATGRARIGWGLGLVLLGALALLPGGRAAFLALLVSVAAGPVLLFLLQGRLGAAALWLGLVCLAGGAGLAMLFMLPALSDQLATLERLLRPGPALDSARGQLWAEAWRLGGWGGLGPGGYPPAIGVGLDRGLHPHNHALEALVEGGAVGLLLWGLTFLGATGVALRLALRVAPLRAAEVFAIGLPVALSAMVSTDLGNRMVWFTLGLALSLGVEARARHALPRHV